MSKGVPDGHDPGPKRFDLLFEILDFAHTSSPWKNPNPPRPGKQGGEDWSLRVFNGGVAVYKFTRNRNEETILSGNFADRLLDAIERRGSPVCVGVDPRYERIPDELKLHGDETAGRIKSIAAFCHSLLDLVAGIVPAVKLQSAYFEAHRTEGVKLYYDLVRRGKDLGLLVIGDVKRSDIGSTAEAYAEAHLSGPDAPDAVTVNGYLGTDGMIPFCKVAAAEAKGIFVLVRTSNPSAAQTQDFADADGARFYEHIGRMTADLGVGEELAGQRGYSSVGAVVAATYPDEARRLREIMPAQIFLVPGYGAQGATAEDCAACFKEDGTGAIVNASRSVIYAHQRDEYEGLEWAEAVTAATRAFADDIARAVTGDG